MKVFLWTALAAFIFAHQADAQVYGCKDPQANNYNPAATINDGSCLYNPASVTAIASYILPASLDENSGLTMWNGNVITHNDEVDTNIYALDTSNGNIMQTYILDHVTNTQWEDISSDENYIYLGDFGNNVNGNRSDLRIYKVSKSSILNNAPVVDTIRFSYSNQVSLDPVAENTTDFDCEAFFITQDSIYLLTKQWTSQKTSLYALPKTPGSHIANLKATLDVHGLITGATYMKTQRLIALSGYSSLLQPFMYLLYDFNGNDFFNGNKRKISVSLPFHQTEGITTENGLKYYLSNERFTQPPALDIPAKLHVFDLSAFLLDYLTHALPVAEVTEKDKFSIFPNPANDHITILLTTSQLPLEYTIADRAGRMIQHGNLNQKRTGINLSQLPTGLYFLTLGNESKTHFKIIRN